MKRGARSGGLAKAQPDLFAAANDRGEAAPKPTLEAEPARSRKQLPPVAPRPPNGLLRVREAAARLGLSKSTLDKMRCQGRGPPFIKITNKVVGYDPRDLDAYADSRRRSPGAKA